MIVLRHRNGQALVKHEESNEKSETKKIKFEWWIDSGKMKENIRMEEKNGKTFIYCYNFYGGYRENWLIEEFDRRVPRYNII